MVAARCHGSDCRDAGSATFREPDANDANLVRFCGYGHADGDERRITAEGALLDHFVGKRAYSQDDRAGPRRFGRPYGRFLP